MFQPQDRHHGTCAKDDHPPASLAGVHVATIPTHVDLKLLGRLLDAVETALLDAGAARVWVDPTRPELSVMAELPNAEE